MSFHAAGGCRLLPGPTGTASLTGDVTGAVNADTLSFSASGHGKILKNGKTDMWTMSNNKELRNTTSGL